MKKLFFTLFAIGALFAFSACGSDDDDKPIDLNVYDTAPLAATYTGTSKIEVVGVANREPVDGQTTVVLGKTTDANTLLLKSTTELTDLAEPAKAKNFKYTTSAKDNITFDMEGTVITYQGSGIPEYILDWFKINFTEVAKVTVTLSSTSVKYAVSSKKMDFVYNADVKVEGTANSEPLTEDYKIKYTYSVSQK